MGSERMWLGTCVAVSRVGSHKKGERAGQRRRSRVEAGKKRNRQIKAGTRGELGRTRKQGERQSWGLRK